jgi:hypothetical protein
VFNETRSDIIMGVPRMNYYGVMKVLRDAVYSTAQDIFDLLSLEGILMHHSRRIIRT